MQQWCAADFMPRLFTPPSVPASCLPASCPVWRLHLQPQLAESPPVLQLAEAQLSLSWLGLQLLDPACPECAAVHLPERLLCGWLTGGPVQEGAHQQGTDWLPAVWGQQRGGEGELGPMPRQGNHYPCPAAVGHSSLLPFASAA